VLDALSAVHRDPSLSDGRLLALAGPPGLPGGCEVHGPVSDLFAGRRCTLRLRAKLRLQEEQRRIAIDRIPPGAGVHTVAEAIDRRAERRFRGAAGEFKRIGELPLARLDVDGESVICEGQPGVDLGELTERLLSVYPVETTLIVQLPAPLAAMLRDWVERFGSEDTEDSLAELDDAARQ
jgi:hypothetical protein